MHNNIKFNEKLASLIVNQPVEFLIFYPEGPLYNVIAHSIKTTLLFGQGIPSYADKITPLFTFLVWRVLRPKYSTRIELKISDTQKKTLVSFYRTKLGVYIQVKIINIGQSINFPWIYEL